MKKLFKLLCLMIVLILTVGFMPAIVSVQSSALAVGGDAIAQRTNLFLKLYVDAGSKLKYNADRVAGTIGESNACANLKQSLDSLTNIVPVADSTTTDGKQEFYYVSARTGKKTKSANLHYRIVGTNSAKRIVLTCNYDNYFKPYLNKQNALVNTDNEEYSEGVNASAASIAFMFALAEQIDANTLGYDIDFVFFGAGYDGNAGANYYLQTLGAADRAKTLLVVDISRIAFGSDVYYYSGEFGSVHDNFYSTLGLKQYKSGISGASVDAPTPLGYENAGYSGATVLFAESGLNYLHLFAGSYEEGVFGGICEYSGKSNVLNTNKDNFDYVTESELEKNFKKLGDGICNLLAANLGEELKTNENSAPYKFFANSKIITWITLIVLLVLLLASVVVHYSILKRTYDYAQKNNVSAVMITLDDEDDSNE